MHFCGKQREGLTKCVMLQCVIQGGWKTKSMKIRYVMLICSPMTPHALFLNFICISCVFGLETVFISKVSEGLIPWDWWGGGLAFFFVSCTWAFVCLMLYQLALKWKCHLSSFTRGLLRGHWLTCTCTVLGTFSWFVRATGDCQLNIVYVFCANALG